MLCDGANEQDLFGQFRARIAQFGFTMVHVGEGSSSWTYTVGLVEGLGHPEFVVTGLNPTAASVVVAGLVERVRAGERYTSASEASYEGVALRFGAVHRSHWRHGRLAMWEAYYDRFGGKPASRSAIQILWPNEDGAFPPDRDFCHEHRNCQPLLAVAATDDVNLPRRGSKRRKSRR